LFRGRSILNAADKLRHIEDLHWVFIGDGRREKWMYKRISELKLEENIHMLGRCDPEDMPYYFSLADALLVTLKQEPIFALTIPSKIQSYLACGKPILGTLDGEGAKIINESGCGYAAAAQDSDGLSEFALKLYKMKPEKRQLMGESGKMYYDKYFDRNRLFKQLEEVMVETIKEGLCES
jgi:glycosyltransferase involved in cell wall biosynthesis